MQQPVSIFTGLHRDATTSTDPCTSALMINGNSFTSLAARPSRASRLFAVVEVLGLEDVPQAGDRVQVIDDTAKAKQIALHCPLAP